MLASLIDLRDPVLQLMELAGPWGAHVDGCSHPGMYVVHRGTMRFANAHLAEGDVVLLPSGGPHVMSDVRGTRAADAAELRRRATYHAGIAVVEGPGPKTLVSAIPFAGSTAMPWLPSIVHVEKRALDPSARSLLVAYEHALANGEADVLARVAEALWIKCIAVQLPELERFDVDVLRAASRVLEQPAARYDLASLARIAGVSRSRFSARFTAALGEAPMRWVNRTRMQHARRLLADGLSAAQVADALSFADESAFRKAFRRTQ